MRAFDQGSIVRVTATREEVYNFASRWPCSGFRYRAFWCLLEASNGDLVDIASGFDGAAASAFVDDCKAYARRRGFSLGLSAAAESSR